MKLYQRTVKTLVLKVGTTLLSGPSGFDGRIVEQLIKELALLKQERRMNILMVSSGAIGCGMSVLKLKQRPKILPQKQATAAIGQSRLMHYYETLFQTYGQGLCTAQVLLTANDLDSRKNYLNVRNTLRALFEIGHVIPIINENDSVATAELRFGDNDTLAAKVAAKIDADLLVILTDIDGLYDKNPSEFPDANLIEQVDSVTEKIMALAGGASAETSVGGMKTKLLAARIANASGVPMVIADGRRENVVHDILSGKGPMTRFGAADESLSHRKRWIAFGRATRGVILVDEGACRALREQGRSLLPAGVIEVRGEFAEGSAVSVANREGEPIGQGLSNFGSADIERIQGCKSSQIEAILGVKDYDEVIHRDNLVLL